MEKPQETDYVKVWDGVNYNIIEREFFCPTGYMFIKTEGNIDFWISGEL